MNLTYVTRHPVPATLTHHPVYVMLPFARILAIITRSYHAMPYLRQRIDRLRRRHHQLPKVRLLYSDYAHSLLTCSFISDRRLLFLISLAVLPIPFITHPRHVIIARVILTPSSSRHLFTVHVIIPSPLIVHVVIISGCPRYVCSILIYAHSFFF
jgi:hypothetical protein